MLKKINKCFCTFIQNVWVPSKNEICNLYSALTKSTNLLICCSFLWALCFLHGNANEQYVKRGGVIGRPYVSPGRKGGKQTRSESKERISGMIVGHFIGKAAIIPVDQLAS